MSRHAECGGTIKTFLGGDFEWCDRCGVSDSHGQLVRCDHRYSVILVTLGVKQCVVCDAEVKL